MQITRPRAVAALTTLTAVLAATVISAAPAAADDARITGTVQLPAGAEYGPITVIAWTPDGTYYDAASTDQPEEDGTFELEGLRSGASYQVAVHDGTGVVGWGYYASGKVVPTAAEAALVKPGTSRITIKAKAAAPVTDIGLVLPPDTFPSWNPSEFVVLEPGTGRVVASAGNRMMPSATGTPLPAVPSLADRKARAAATQGAFAAAVAATSGQEVTRIDLPTAGLAAGVDYTVAATVAVEGVETSLDNAYFYGGVNRGMVRKLSSAGTFPGGAAKLDVLVMGATAKTAPTVSGTAKVGKKLTAKAGTFSLPGKVSYQWLRNGKAISGATSSTYTVRSADKGAKVSVRTTLVPTTPGYGHAVKSSAQTAKVVLGDAPKATALPKVSGTVKVGKKLTATRGTWSTTGLTYSYRWQRDGKDIKGATKSTYVLTKADKGKKIRVKVTVTKAGYASGSARSNPTVRVAK